MDEEIAQLKIVSYHLSTTVPPSYAVKQELVLPSRAHTFEDLQTGRVESIRVPFTHPLGPEQRNWWIPLDLFRYPSKIFVHTPNTKILLGKSRSCLDVLILTPNLPKKLFLQLHWDARDFGNERLPQIILVSLDGREQPVELCGASS